MPDQPVDWIGAGLGERHTTLRDLVEAISALGTQHLGRRWVWRGVPDATWRVQSTLWRRLPKPAPDDPPYTEEDMRDAEVSVLDKARSWGLGLSGTSHVPDLQLLASLQHHGAPTRLLDVTLSPYTGLWFATGAASPTSLGTGALLAIDVTGIPSHQTVPLNPVDTYESVEDPRGWGLTSALKESAEQATSFLVQPTVRDARMTAQEGLFLASAVPDPRTTGTFTGVDGFALNPARTAALDPTSGETFDPFDASPRAFRAFVVPAHIKPQVRLWLSGVHNRRERTIFPDLAGIAAHYRARREQHQPSLVDLAEYDADPHPSQ